MPTSIEGESCEIEKYRSTPICGSITATFGTMGVVTDHFLSLDTSNNAACTPGDGFLGATANAVSVMAVAGGSNPSCNWILRAKAGFQYQATASCSLTQSDDGLPVELMEFSVETSIE